ncbi:hypothetical protein [Halosolutus gelatinilyticus]|uniref:hypothetical protein n=1 Tax=Halosolutus gelatinilyticus TaxID=2931975 RepID=UPI001FF68EC1|nr:hypothetical protein [Halosolutus gelatinilyticus]
MDKERLPRWGWLLIGLLIAAIAANLVTFVVLRPAGLPDEYQVIPIITAMAPVLIYVGIWHDEERQAYWEHSREHIVGDVLFVVAGAALGSSVALVTIVEFGLWQIVQDVITMGTGFVLSWGLFWWRNPDLYRDGSDR